MLQWKGKEEMREGKGKEERTEKPNVKYDRISEINKQTQKSQNIGRAFTNK